MFQNKVYKTLIRVVSSCSSGTNCTIYDGECVKKCGAMERGECSQNSDRCYVGDGGNCYAR